MGGGGRERHNDIHDIPNDQANPNQTHFICAGLLEDDAHKEWDLKTIRGEYHDHGTWYTEKRRVPGKETHVRVIHATECMGIFRRTSSTKQTCDHCLSLWKKSAKFRNALRRTHDKAPEKKEQSRDVRARLMTRDDLVKARAALLKKLRRVQFMQIKRAAKALAVRGLRQRNPCDQMTEFINRGDVKGITSTLTAFGNQTVASNGKAEVALEIVKLMLKNMSKANPSARKGRKISPGAMNLLCAIRIVGGESSYNLFAQNTGMPHERTVRRAMNEQTINFREGMHEGNFVLAAQIYKAHMKEHGIPFGSVPVLFAEDETAIIPAWWWDVHNDIFGGTCGRLCGRKCATKAECTGNGCLDPHSCNSQATHELVPGDRMESYDEMQKFADDHRCCTHMRLIILNPLLEGMPRIPIMIQGTCLTFSCDDFVLPQWDQLAVWYNRHLRSVIGPRIGESSDGDSRRRKAFWRASMRGVDMPPPRNFTLNVPGFTMSGIIVNDQTTFRMDQDCIHNLKKLINVLNSSSRQITLCTHPMTLSGLEIVKTSFLPQTHGLQMEDLIRGAQFAMDVPSALRLTTQKFLRCIRILSVGNAANERLPYMDGYLLYLGMCRKYISIFLSREISWQTRIQRAGYVITFLRLWRLQITNHPDLRRNTHFITNQAFKDVLLSCHFVVLLIKYYALNYPGQSIPFHLTGTDVCEEFFSSLGSWNLNKRTYTVLEAIVSVRAKLHLASAVATGRLVMPTKNRRRKAVFDEDEDADDDSNAEIAGDSGDNNGDGNDDNADQDDWDDDGDDNDSDSNGNDDQDDNNDAEIAGDNGDNNGDGNDADDHEDEDDLFAKEFLIGVKEAQADLGKIPKFRPKMNRRRHRATWWDYPENYDPKNTHFARNPLNEEDMLDANRADSETDSDEDQKEQENEAMPNENQHDDNGGKSDENNHDSDDDDDGKHDEMVLGSPEVPDEAAMAAAAVCLASVVPENISLTVAHVVQGFAHLDAEGKVQRVHKQTVCKRLNKGRAKISSDKYTRVMVNQQIKTSNKSDHDAFDLRMSPWVVGLQNDIACVFKNSAQLGRIVRMRKRVNNGWVTYRKPFVLHEDRTGLGDLYVNIYCYKRIQGPPGKRFKFNTATLEQVHVTMIVCPVTLTRTSNGIYTLDDDHDKLIKLNRKGNTIWDGDEL